MGLLVSAQFPFSFYCLRMFHCSLGYICFGMTFSLFNYQCVSGICERQDLRKIDIRTTSNSRLLQALEFHILCLFLATIYSVT